jgi:hypothetical protein
MFPSMSSMTLLVIFGGIVCGWTMLSVLSGERYRRLRQIETETPPEEPVAPSIHIATSPAPQGKKPKPAVPPAKRK